jgi:hypothetical protein
VIQRMSYREYVDVPGVRFSDLKEMRISPLHYRVRSQVEHPDTPSTILGRAVHAAVFEPELFEAEYVVCDLDRRTKAWKEFREENDPEKILKPSERDNVLRIADAVHANPAAAEVLALPGQAEQVVTWIDPETGIARKARMDWATPPDLHIVTDLKTAADISDNGFGRAAGRYCYHGQLVDYAGGLEVETGVPYDALIIAVENTDVADVRVIEIVGAELDSGRQLVRALHDRLAECLETDTWPGQFSGRGKLSMMPWDLWDDDKFEDAPASTGAGEGFV